MAGANRGKGWLVAGGTLVGLAAALLAGVEVLVWRSSVEAEQRYSSPAYALPMRAELTLERGTYAVYVRTDDVAAGPSLTVKVTTAKGWPLEVHSAATDGGLTVGRETFARREVFDVPATGRYTVAATVESWSYDGGGNVARVAAAGSDATLLVELLAVLAAIVLGACFLVLGVVLLVIGFVRRRRATRRARQPAGS